MAHTNLTLFLDSQISGNGAGDMEKTNAITNITQAQSEGSETNDRCYIHAIITFSSSWLILKPWDFDVGNEIKNNETNTSLGSKYGYRIYIVKQEVFGQKKQTSDRRYTDFALSTVY